jgi:hypothetical protein
MIKHGMQRLQNSFDSLARRHPVWLTALALAFSVLYTGLSVASDTVYFRLSLDPFRTRCDIVPVNYFQESLLQPLLAHVLGLGSLAGYSLFCVVVVLGGFSVFAALMARRVQGGTAGLLFLLLLAHPVRGVLYSFLGMPDALTFALTVPFLFLRAPVALAFLASLMATNHGMSFFIVPALCALRWSAREPGFRWPQLVAAIVGLAAGYGLLHGFMTLYDIRVVSRYDCAIGLPIINLIHNNFSQFPMTLFSFHGVLWLALVASFGVLWSSARRYVVLALLMQVGLYGVTFFTADTTRVFALLAWAPAVHAVISANRHVESVWPAESREQWQMLLLFVGLAGLLIPMYSVWGGVVLPCNSLPFYQSLLARLPGLR